MNIKHRLGRLEGKAEKAASQWLIPLEVRVLLRVSERHHARIAGEELPPYSEGELHHLYRGDLEDAAGAGVLAQCRNSPGWQDSESRRLLDEWQAGARRRLELVAELGERWRDAYDCDLLEDDDLDTEVGPM
jgi:hypothetical protein